MENFDNIISQSCTKSTEKFWQAVQLWLKSPHLINRRILASTQLSIFQLKNINNRDILKWFINFKNDLLTVENIEKTILDSLKKSNFLIENIDIYYDLENMNYNQNKENTIYVHLDKLLPRHCNKFSQTLQITLIDIQYNCITQFFHNYCNDEGKKSLGFTYPYQIKYEDNCISIFVQHLNEWKDNANLQWLKHKFFYKFLKWVENEEKKNSLVNGSLKHIVSEQYTNLYNNLKIKYGMEMVKIWPERTDPQKFVYEDIAIATYLIVLWELEREKLNIKEKQSFLDLGCGNGLLVHILNSEGHPGLGIDLRKRKIWDFYPETTQLKVF
jgi:tRNASer (uridine44-2'-O)-methyltransferase